MRQGTETPRQGKQVNRTAASHTGDSHTADQNTVEQPGIEGQPGVGGQRGIEELLGTEESQAGRWHTDSDTGRPDKALRARQRPDTQLVQSDIARPDIAPLDKVRLDKD